MKRRRAQVGDRLVRRDKLTLVGYAWAVVRDRIDARPTDDGTVYVAVLCEGLGKHTGGWFVWRLYFTPNRNGILHFGQYGPQAPLAIDREISNEIIARGWYDRFGEAKPAINSGCEPDRPHHAVAQDS